MVTPSALARQSSEIRLSQADDYLATLATARDADAPRGTLDAGSLNLQVQALNLAGQVRFGLPAAGPGQRQPLGGELNLSAQHIQVADQADPSADALVITPAQLAATGAQSVLLGGVRSGTGATRQVSVGADTVEVNATGVLQAQDLGAGRAPAGERGRRGDAARQRRCRCPPTCNCKAMVPWCG